MISISSHVLDTSTGRPAARVAVRLESFGRDSWVSIADVATDSNGRVAEFGTEPLSAGVHRLVFGTGQYYARQDVDCFFPEVTVLFLAVDDRHYHVPLLLSPFGYSTYRGS